jgi:hypothetical protein
LTRLPSCVMVLISRRQMKTRRYYNTEARQAFYVERMLQQDGKCLICKRKTKLTINHDPDTGVMRGLLCHEHNIGLKYFKDSVEALEKAVLFLLAHQLSNTEANINYSIDHLLNDNTYPSDRARARALAAAVNTTVYAAQSRISRARKKLKKNITPTKSI